MQGYVVTTVWQFPWWVNQVANFESKLYLAPAQKEALRKMTETNGTNEKEDGVGRRMLNSEHLQNTGCRIEIGGPSQQAFLNMSNIGCLLVVGHVREV